MKNPLNSVGVQLLLIGVFCILDAVPSPLISRLTTASIKAPSGTNAKTVLETDSKHSTTGINDVAVSEDSCKKNYENPVNSPY